MVAQSYSNNEGAFKFVGRLSAAIDLDRYSHSLSIDIDHANQRFFQIKDRAEQFRRATRGSHSFFQERLLAKNGFRAVAWLALFCATTFVLLHLTTKIVSLIIGKEKLIALITSKTDGGRVISTLLLFACLIAAHFIVKYIERWARTVFPRTAILIGVAMTDYNRKITLRNWLYGVLGSILASVILLIAGSMY